MSPNSDNYNVKVCHMSTFNTTLLEKLSERVLLVTDVMQVSQVKCDSSASRYAICDLSAEEISLKEQKPFVCTWDYMSVTLEANMC